MTKKELIKQLMAITGNDETVYDEEKLTHKELKSLLSEAKRDKENQGELDEKREEEKKAAEEVETEDENVAVYVMVTDLWHDNVRFKKGEIVKDPSLHRLFFSKGYATLERK